MRKLLLATLIVAGFGRSRPAEARDVEAGRIWNNADAQSKCAAVCRPPEKWNGQWRTTVPGKMSVCGCVMDPMQVPPTVVVPPPPPAYPPPRDPMYPPPQVAPRQPNYPPPLPPAPTPPPPLAPATAHDVNAGPIWNNGDAQQKCPNVCVAPETWNGQWRTTVPNRMSVCGCNYAVADITGVYEAHHPDWRDGVTIRPDGRFQRNSGDGGSWTFDGRVLVLKWDRWGAATLVMQPDGRFFDAQQNFRMRPRNQQPPAYVQTPPPPPPEFRSRFLRLDRGSFASSEQPIVYWDNAPTSGRGWVSIVASGTEDGAWGDWTYVRGQASGSFAATRPLPPGNYEVRYYADTMSPVVDRLSFTVY